MFPISVTPHQARAEQPSDTISARGFSLIPPKIEELMMRPGRRAGWPGRRRSRSAGAHPRLQDGPDPAGFVTAVGGVVVQLSFRKRRTGLPIAHVLDLVLALVGDLSEVSGDVERE
jgi:hypothetical protein